MSEAATIQKSDQPITTDSLIEDLQNLGLQPGMTVLVHSSLSALGWVCGGAVAVIKALEAVLGPDGTLVMPTHSSELSEPSYWENPPVPESWWTIIRDAMPGFDPDLTPTRQMGIVAEVFRKHHGVIRSYHPMVSFAAKGQHAKSITANHSLIDSLGENSPLARIYDLDGHVLLLGVGHANNTSMHLAEYRADFPGKQRHMQGSPVIENGQRQWVTFEDVDLTDEDFPCIGEAFATTGYARPGKVGQGEALFMPQTKLVDFAVTWMNTHRH